MDANPSGIPQDFLEKFYAIPGNRVAIRYLVDQIRGGGVTAFAGTGVSASAGYPLWKEFLRKTAESARLPTDGGIPKLTQRILDAAGRMFLEDAVEETFGFQKWESEIPPGPLRVLPYLTNRVVTTTIDNSLEAAYASINRPFQEKCTWERDPLNLFPRIWKLYGTVEDHGSLLLTAEGVQRALDRPGFTESIERLTQGDSLLFIGVSASDLVDAWFLKHIRSSRAHYAVLGDSRGSVDPKPFANQSIRVIYSPGSDPLSEELLLRHVCDLAGISLPAISLPAISAPPPIRLLAAPVPDTPPAPPVPEVPADLIESCRNGECVLFAGAGLSARAAVPTWNVFLAGLLAFARDHKIVEPDYAASLESALEVGERADVADGLVQAFGEQRDLLLDFLRESFPESVSLSPAHEWLRQTPFATVVTTNYDRLMELAFPEFAQEGLFTSKDAEGLLDALSQKRRFILKLYGIIERPETLIFAPIEYREALSSNVSFLKFMEGFFFSRNFLFMGLSLEGIQDFLAGFVFRGSSPRKHFALVGVSGSAWKAKADLLQRRYNINVIPIPVSETFPELDDFVQKLSYAARPITPMPGAAPAPAVAPAPGIRRVILEDIGPYQRLDLEFPKDKNWKILLGDNGVGKSTILKAIATAIAGSDARSYAARLVRAGATRGRITLITEQNPSGYVTDILTKDMTSEAEVVSIPSRPMEAEGWLALGFSPLRVVTWTPSSGPQGMVQKGRPTADDLLPLLSGETDPRMDRLKQWIVNLDAAAKSAQPKPGEDGNPPNEAIHKFFGLMATLTDRKDIGFLRVTDNFRVLVRVADVKDGVPLEVLSQGLTSLFGWIGVLCQRLKETLQNPTQDPLPTNAYALVLIDELDAHMHPRWQQVLVHRLKKVFPHVQFIACTHSPLIVGGMEKQEVDRLTIRKGKIEKMDFEPDMTFGRTDQILTGQLFDLPTTLDPATQDLMTEYEDLLGMSNRSDEEEKRFLELGGMIEQRIPPSPSMPVERRSRELLETLQLANLEGLAAEHREKIEERMIRLSKTLNGDDAS